MGMGTFTNIVDKVEPTRFVGLVLKATCYSDVIRALGMSICGASHHAVRKRIAELQVTTAHFLRKPGFSSIKLELQLVRNSNANRVALKKKLTDARMLDNTCLWCGLGEEWNGKKLTLQLDHINGDSKDNRLSNLRVLCPNCHTQTETFGGRSKKKAKKYCIDCQVVTKGFGEKCPTCHSKNQQEKFSITKEELEKLVWLEPSSKIAKRFGVSGKAIENRCKRFNVTKPPRGYWSKFRSPSSTS